MVSFERPSWAVVAVGSVVIYALYYLHWELTVGASRRQMIKENGCQPIVRHSELYSFFGWDSFKENMALMKSHAFLPALKSRYDRFGYTWTAVILGSTKISTVEPENAKTILSLKFKDWGLGDRRKSAFVPLLGHGIFTTDGAAWQHSRELLRPNFVRTQVADLDMFDHHADHLISNIPTDKSTVNLQPLFFRLTLDSATEFLFGESTDCLLNRGGDDAAAGFAAAFNRSQESIAVRVRYGILADLWPNKNMKKDIKFIHQYIDNYVRKGIEYAQSQDSEKTKSEEGERYVFLHELARRTQDPVQIRSELLNILIAGRDTTASLMSNLFFVLAKRQDIWQKLHAEVDQLDGKKPTYAQIKDMKYLRMVINEILRLYPVIPGNSRTAEVDTVLPLGGGPDGKSPLFIEKGQAVSYASYAMHRRQDFYGPDADEFRPERWETLRPGWEYLPFNGGPRICIGQQFAITEASYTTARLLQTFKGIESRDPAPWTENLTLTCVGQACKVGLTLA
ncbi:hypothetical protein MMC12_006878 [Toensbergia leucococca]|nr:hypothetical protein [Toensbergia leucococca]